MYDQILMTNQMRNLYYSNPLRELIFRVWAPVKVKNIFLKKSGNKMTENSFSTCDNFRLTCLRCGN